MKAVIVVFNPDHTIKQIIGPYDSGQAASDDSAALEWSAPRMIVMLTAPTTEPCEYTLSHTRDWCGNPGCRES